MSGQTSKILPELERRLTAAQNELDDLLSIRWPSTREEKRIVQLRESIFNLNDRINAEIDQIPLIPEDAA